MRSGRTARPGKEGTTRLAGPGAGLFDGRVSERAAGEFAELGEGLSVTPVGDVREDGQGVVESGEVDHEERGQDDDDQRRHRPHPDQLGQAVACDTPASVLATRNAALRTCSRSLVPPRNVT